jgi:hypothetical protein
MMKATASGVAQIQSQIVKQSPQPRTNFVQKLYSMVSDSSTDGFIVWIEGGKAFEVLRTGAASKEAAPVLQAYFKHSSFKSFCRQLNMYHFTRTQDKERWIFFNPHFRKDTSAHLDLIKRKRGKTAEPNPADPKRAKVEKIDPLQNRPSFNLGTLSPAATPMSVSTIAGRASPLHAENKVMPSNDRKAKVQAWLTKRRHQKLHKQKRECSLQQNQCESSLPTSATVGFVFTAFQPPSLELPPLFSDCEPTSPSYYRSSFHHLSAEMEKWLRDSNSSGSSGGGSPWAGLPSQ